MITAETLIFPTPRMHERMNRSTGEGRCTHPQQEVHVLTHPYTRVDRISGSRAHQPNCLHECKASWIRGCGVHGEHAADVLKNWWCGRHH